MSQHNNIEVKRRRKGSGPTGRADAPQRPTGGGGLPGGSGMPPMGGYPSGGGGGFPTRGAQIGGCGTIVLFIVIAAFYMLSGGQLDIGGLTGDGGVPQQNFPQDTSPFQPQVPQFSEPPASNFTPPAPATGAGDTWTILLYQDADDQVLEKDIFVDFNEAERVGSTDRVRIVSQIDRFAGAYSGDGNWTGARRYYLTQDSDLNAINSEMVQELGEVDMSDGASLVDFIQWAAATFPADHYVLILSDHGLGWPGGWSDPAPGGFDRNNAPLASRLGDNIYLNELDQALQRGVQASGIGRFDIIGMDACLMAQLEVMAALQPYAQYAVASEETEPALGWAYASFLGDLVQNPDMSAAQLSGLIVDSYIDDDQRIADPAARADFMSQGSPMGGIFGYAPASAEQIVAQLKQGVTISAINLDALPALMESVNTFSYALQNENQQLVAEARSYTQSYTSIFGKQVPPAYIDLGHFAALLANNTRDADVKQSAEQLFAALQQAVIAEKHGPGKKGSTGLAIYFPNSTLYSSPLAGPQSYTVIANRFAQTSLWDDFLGFHYTDRNFQFQTREPVIPDAGFPVRAPGQGNISVSEITKSSDTAAPGQPVRLSVDISGENIGYVYLFVGYLDTATNSLAILDTDYLESPDTREVNGVFYPVWGTDFTMSFEWDPIVFAINDGQQTKTALFVPESYGATAEQAVYTVEGVYRFADGGDELNARLYFMDGNLVQVMGFRGSEETGAPREITPQPNDTFTLLDTWLTNASSGNVAEPVYVEGDTFTFGIQPFRWEELYAAAGEYVVGFIIEDLDGNEYPVYTRITVQ